MNSFLISLMVLLLFATKEYINSQTINGIVKSIETGENLDNVFIEINAETVGISASDGTFEIFLDNTIPVTLVFKRLGYEEHIVRAEYRDFPLTVFMREKLLGTDEILVNNTLLCNNHVLNTFYLNSGINSIDELLSKSPGLSVVRRGNYASEPVLRGLNSERLTITLNGMKLQSACTDKMDPVTSYAETENLKSIEISKGVLTCGNQNDKFGCIGLNLESAETSVKSIFEGSLSMAYNTVSQGKYADVNLNLSTKWYGSVVNIVYKTSGNYKTGNGDIITYSGYNKFNIMNSQKIKISRNLNITTDIIYDHAWDIGYPALTMDVKSAKAFLAGIKFNIYFLTKYLKSIEAKTYCNFVDHMMDNSRRNNYIKMDMPGKTSTFGTYVSGKIILGKILSEIKIENLITRARAEMTMNVPGTVPMFMLTWPDIFKNNISVSVNIRKDMSRILAGQLGFNLAYVKSAIKDSTGYNGLTTLYPALEKIDNRMLWNLGCGLEFIPSVSLRADISYAYNVRDLSVSEQYGFYIFNRQDSYDYVGNPNINNEVMHQAELEINYSIPFFTTRFNMFGYFFNEYITGRIDPVLSPMTYGSNGVKKYLNIAGAMIYGFESQTEAGISDYLKIINIFYYTRGTEFSGASLPQIPPLSGNLTLRYNVGNIGLQAEAVWSATQNKPDINYGETTTPSFMICNIRASWRPVNQLTITTGIENIFNRSYYEHLDWQKLERAGRNFYFKIKAEI